MKALNLQNYYYYFNKLFTDHDLEHDIFTQNLYTTIGIACHFCKLMRITLVNLRSQFTYLKAFVEGALYIIKELKSAPMHIQGAK